jgi:AcrR family transcriptional regulator
MSAASTAGATQPGTSRGPYRNGVQRRQQILDTAVKIFGQYGYAGGSLRRIAEEVGVSTPALIRHFGSKEGLFTAVLEQSDRRNTARSVAGVHGLEYLRRFADVVATNVRNRGMVELLLTVATEASDPDHPAHPFMVERYRRVVTNLAAELRHAGEVGQIPVMSEAELDAEARGLAALMDGVELQWLLDPEVDLVGLYAHHFKQLVARWQHGFQDTRSPDNP